MPEGLEKTLVEPEEGTWHDKVLKGAIGIAAAVGLYTIFWLLENPNGELTRVRLPVIIVVIYHYVGKTIPSLLIALGGASLCWEGISEFRKQRQDETETPSEQQGWERLPFSLKTTLIGAILGGVAVPVTIFLDLPWSMQIGIDFIDRIPFSLGGGPIVIILAAMIWSVIGAVSGFTLSCICGFFDR